MSEENISRYMKNFRKRMWPKGVMAENPPERTKTAKEITRILTKTKMLSFLTGKQPLLYSYYDRFHSLYLNLTFHFIVDDLRHILGGDTTRRGIFDLFDLFQHRSLNKRFIYIVIENLIVNFFETTNANSLTTSISFNNQLLLHQTTLNGVSNGSNQLVISPFNYIVRLHLTRSSRVKPEFKLKLKIQQLDFSDTASIASSNSLIISPTTSRKQLSKQTTITQANVQQLSPTLSNKFVHKQHRKMPSNVSIGSTTSNSSNKSLNMIHNQSMAGKSVKSVNFNNLDDNNDNVEDENDELDALKPKRAGGSQNSQSNMTRSKSLHSEIQC